MKTKNVNFCKKATEFQILRSNSLHDATIGTLYINGQEICDTAENSTTALPAGKYRIVRHFCKQHDRYMPIVIKGESGALLQLESRCSQCVSHEDVSLNTVMPCICPMLKPGNGVHKRHDGSIILGTVISAGCLKHPLEAFNSLTERIRKAVKRNTVINLTINEQ